MRFENVTIESLGYHLPENVITSDDLEERLKPLYDRLKLPVGRLEMMSGIQERRFWNEGVLPSQVSSLAGENGVFRKRATPLGSFVGKSSQLRQGTGFCHPLS